MDTDRSVPLTALRAFHAAARALSFQDAAQALAVTPSAVSHQVRALEEWLGQPLFRRTARRVELTMEGKALLKAVTRAFAELDRATGQLRGAARAPRRLRLSALPLFTSAWLIPRLEDFERRHPAIDLAIDTTNRMADVLGGEVDIAIRNQRRPTPGLHCRKLIDARPVPLCAPRLKALLKTPADLAGVTLIHHAARPQSWARWLAAVGVSQLKAKRDLTFDSLPDALEAAARGRGVALAIDPLVWSAPVARRLVRAFEHRVPAESAYYLVHRKVDLARPALRAFVEWVVAEMERYVREEARRDSRASSLPSRDDAD